MDGLDRILVLLVDDHPVVRHGLQTVLQSQPDLALAGEAMDGSEAIRVCERLHPDVILMDLMMPGMDGVTATKEIHQRWPEINIIILTSFEERELVDAALKAGAIGYLLKDVTAKELVGAVREAAAGHPQLSPGAAKALIQEVRQPRHNGFRLTRREKEVLKLMVQGAQNAVIAEKLFISESAVKFHVGNILSKFGVASRTEAVVKAMNEKLA